MGYILIGKIVNTHGIRGEVKIQSYSDFDEERYRKGNTVYIQYEKEYIPLKTLHYREHKGNPLVSFVDHEDINLVEKYRNCNVYIDEKDRPALPEGEYYRDQLKNLTVKDEEGNIIGQVKRVEETFGAQNNLRVTKEDGKDVLIPNIPVFVKNVDLEEGIIVIHVEKGLL